MSDLAEFGFERKRGVVWVCDIEKSSKALNDNVSAAQLEEFLPRLYWVSVLAVKASGGHFIKWTGDGFLAWYDCPLHRELGDVASRVMQAAYYLTTLVNVTKLGAVGPHKTAISHAITYEQDALAIRITHTDKHESLDLIGRAVVLAFRMTGIAKNFPRIATHREVYEALDSSQTVGYKFSRLKQNSDLIAKRFKGERWGTNGVYVSVSKTNRATSVHTTYRHVKRVVTSVESQTARAESFSDVFFALMESGPDWCIQAAEDYGKFVRDELLGSLKNLLPVLEKAAKEKKRPVQKEPNKCS